MKNEQTVVEWLESKLGVYSHEDLLLFQKAKEMEKKSLERFYIHGQWAMIDNGHGDSFEDYYKKIYSI